TNVLGTVRVLEAVRETPSARAVLVVTSDKVYVNDGSGRSFREDDRLGGGDPYSSSKACQEIVAACYRENFFTASHPRVAVARAGNVIGGGDWAADRLVPDFVRAAASAQSLVLRHPEATRPWQHVLDPLAGYLIYIERLFAADGDGLPAALNFGPPAASVQPVGRVVDALAERWGGGVSWKKTDAAPAPEATALALDASLARRSLGWRPRLDFAQALDWTAAWYRAHCEGRDMRAYSLDELRRYAGLSG
ncbi:MAG: CDP-glucose 4,6-dehydratase, partial [Alphaproteobacteria bacterium]